MGQLASISGDFIVIAALPFAVFSMGGSDGQLALAFGAGAFFEVLVLLFGGAVGDRHQRRAVMITADLCRFASQAVLSVLLILGVAEFWQLVLVQMIQGIGAAFFNPAMDGMVPEVTAERRLHEANALLTTAFACGSMLGPALAGALIAFGGVGLAFAADALTFGASAILLASIRVPARHQEKMGSLLADVFEGWSEFRKRTWLWVVVVEFALLNALVFAPFQMLGASVAAESLGGLGAWIAIFTASGVGRLAGGVIALFWQPQRPLLIATLVIGSWAAPLSLLALAAPLPAIAATAAVAGAALSVFAANWRTTLQREVPVDQRSRMGSYDWLGSLALLPLGYLIAGAGQSFVSVEATLIGGACIVLAATAIVISLPAIRDIRATRRLSPLALANAVSDQAG